MTTETERESIDFDVLFVGAGPASLSGALHLSNLIKKHNKKIDAKTIEGEKLDETQITVIEKGAEIGSHALSGAVLDPKAIKELVPDFETKEFPSSIKVSYDTVHFLTSNTDTKVPVIPPALQNHGFSIISLNKTVKWLAELVEANNVNVFPAFPGTELLYDGDKVVGVRTGDKGIDKDGKPKPNFEPGADLKAKITVLGEGPRGTLTKQLVEKYNLAGFNPQIYSTGVKELWEVPAGNLEPGKVIHTMGYPLANDEFGGGFVYNMTKSLIAIGFVVGLDYKNPCMDPHEELQRFKKHPFISSLLKGAKLSNYGAKTISEGGWDSMPQLFTDGCLIIGDSAGFLNAQRLKGIHLAIKSGMLAAETIFDSLVNKEYSKNRLQNFKTAVDNSWIKTELYSSRNFRQQFHKGIYSGILKSGLSMMFGLGKKGPVKCIEDHESTKKLSEFKTAQEGCPKTKPDDKLTFSKITDVYYSGTVHEKEQPCHLRISDINICNGKCKEEYGNPCQHFCPANVYEMVEDEQSKTTKLALNPENCVHCKTCDIADPYAIITWVPPEGGGGPKYNNM